MDYALPIIALIAGLGLGGAAVWFLVKAKIAGAVAERSAELNPQSATLDERVKRIGELEAQLINREERVASLQNEVTDLKTKRSELQTMLDKERTGAEEKL